MSQRVALAKGYRDRYFGPILSVAVMAAACRPGPQSIAPQGLAPVDRDSVAGWVAVYAPRRTLRYDLRWSFRNDRGAAGGKAAVRIAPPDSLRFDYRGPFGRSGAAVVIGDSGVWAKPEGDFRDVLQSAPLFWAALGHPLPPPDASPVWGLRRDAGHAWRYAVASDTFDFVEIRGQPDRLLAEMRRGGRIVGMVEARFAPGGEQVRQARLDFPAAQSRFSFRVDGVDSAATLGTETWQRP